MITIRRSADRGHVVHDWLDSHHTFSFGGYHDPAHTGFGPLRVLNDDRVDPGAGFPPHAHRNMEIVSIVLDGALRHEDTMGNGSVIRPGDVQVMRAGRFVQHSEMNASRTEPVRFLQIWLLPRASGGEPGYAQRDFGLADGVTLVVSGDGRDGSLCVDQDADLWRVRLPAGTEHTHPVRKRRAWVHVIDGTLDVSGARLFPGDAVAVTDLSTLSLVARTAVDALLFDLP